MSQKYFSVFLFVCVLLTACAAQPTAPTATTTFRPTSTLIPTETPISSATPTATVTPEPPLPAEIIAEFDGSGYVPHWKDGAIIVVDAKTKQQIPELTVDPATAEITRTYIFDNPAGGAEELTVKYTKEELIARNFSAWEIKDGNWVRKHVVHEGQVTDIPLYSIPEMVRVIQLETQKIKDANGGMLPQKYSSLTQSHIYELFPQDGKPKLTYEGIDFDRYHPPNDIYTYKGYNRVYVRDQLTGQYDINSFIFTTFYAYVAVDNEPGDGRYGDLILEMIEGRKSFFIDKPKLTEHSLGEPNPFRTD